MASTPLFNIVRADFQTTLEQANVQVSTIADMQVNGIESATQLLFAGGGNIGRYINSNDYVNLTQAVSQLLSVQCGQGVAMATSDRDNLATICMVAKIIVAAAAAQAAPALQAPGAFWQFLSKSTIFLSFIQFKPIYPFPIINIPFELNLNPQTTSVNIFLWS